MSLMTVERLRTTLHSSVPVPPERCEAWQQAFSEQDGDALGAGLVHDDEWLLIRHLRIETRWRADAVDADVGMLWGRALRRSIEAALARGDDANCVRYTSRRDAIADMLYRSAFGERTRQWAWHRMELIARADMSCSGVLDSGVHQLLSAPELVWPVLQRIVAAEEATASLTALLRALPVSAWTRLFAASPHTAPYVHWIGEVIHGASPFGGDTAEGLEIGSSLSARQLLAWAEARPHFVQRHVDTLAVLLAALAWPAMGSTGEVSRRRASMAGKRLVGALSRAEVAHGVTTLPAHAKATQPAARDASAIERDEASIKTETAPHETLGTPTPPELPALPDTTQWQSARWAGALFWLSRISTSDAFDWLDSQQDAPADGLRLLLRALAIELGVPEDDPAFAVFCGGTAPQSEPPPAITEKAADMAVQWSNWLADAAPELPVPRLATVCRRNGRLRVEPGWIELHFPLAGVDTTIRRLGLDLDPGWLPWLGCVLRIHYDE